MGKTKNGVIQISNINSKMDIPFHNGIESNQIKEDSKINESSLINLSQCTKENTQISKFSKIPEKKFYTRQKVNKGPWTSNEDKLLKEYVQKNGAKKWHLCAEFIKNRTGKQCREHWKNCLNPDLIKGNWTYEEDLLIMVFYLKCNGSWKEMIHLFNNRTENSIKNRFYSQLRKIASNDSENTSKKRSSKIDLEHLLKYLQEGIAEAKLIYMSRNKLSEEEYNKYIKKMEIKFNNKKKEKKKKKGKKKEYSINKKNKYNLLGKKREKNSPNKIPEKPNDIANIEDINLVNDENIKTTGLTNNNSNKEDNKNEEIKGTSNKKESKSTFDSLYKMVPEEDDINFNNNINSFLEINQMNLMNDNSFIFSESNEDEKVDESLENSVENSVHFFPNYEQEILNRRNSDIISRINYNIFPFEKR